VNLAVGFTARLAATAEVAVAVRGAVPRIVGGELSGPSGHS